jgi:hypothetical protein
MPKQPDGGPLIQRPFRIASHRCASHSGGNLNGIYDGLGSEVAVSLNRSSSGPPSVSPLPPRRWQNPIDTDRRPSPDVAGSPSTLDATVRLPASKDRMGTHWDEDRR